MEIADLIITGKYRAESLMKDTILTLDQVCRVRGHLTAVCLFEMDSWLNAETPTTTTMSKGWDMEEFLREAIPVT